MTTCTMGVGCDEVGVCFAAAHDKPDECPMACELCAFCGLDIVSPCDSAPVDTCERALNITYAGRK